MSNNPAPRARGCFQKKAYPTEAHAQKVANRCYHERGTKLRVYPCYDCGSYHLTKQIHK